MDVEEYCVSEGWVKVAAGKTVDRKGKPLLIKLKGKVEALAKGERPAKPARSSFKQRLDDRWDNRGQDPIS